MAEQRAHILRIPRILQTPWLRPLISIAFAVVAWDLAIRIFRIPPYQIPSPDSVLRTLWSDGPELLLQAIPTTIATIGGFLLAAAFGVAAAVLIAGSRTIESYIYPLLVFSQS